jgi:uncharacterized repeat protein (TIGR01451 family)
MTRQFQLFLRFAFVIAAVLLIFVWGSHLKTRTGSFGTVPAFAATASEPDLHDDLATRARLSSSYGKLPISFEPNEGQAAGAVQYLAHGAGYSLFLTPGELLLTLHASLPEARRPHGAPAPAANILPTVKGAENAATVRMQLIGSNKGAQALGADPLPGKSNYLTGSDPAKWHTDIPTYAKVRYQDVYPGIDLVYYGNQEGKLEHDFVVAPGADPQQIEFSLSDEDRTPALKDGEIRLHSKAGDIRLRAPLAYQVIDGERRPVVASYQAADSGHMRFRIGSYDSRYPLVIDPVLVHSAVFGGSGYVENIAIDTARNAYVTGFTFSQNFPLEDPYQSNFAIAFVSKLNSSGTALLYSTYLGGTSSYPYDIAVDASGRIYLSGVTGPGFPLVNAYQPTYGGNYDAFITVLNPSGNALEWSTYLGGPYEDDAVGLALDPSDNVYVTGYSDYSFPELHGIPGAHCAGDVSICTWVAKFNKAGALQYSTIFGAGLGLAIAADSDGSAYITGLAFGGGDTPTTPGAFQSGCPGGSCPFVAKLSPAGNSLLYSTTLGIPGRGKAIAIDSGLNAYVGGLGGPGLTVGSTAFQRSYQGGNSDGFVVKLNANGSNLISSTYLGGSGDDFIHGLVLDQYRDVYVSGYTTSPNFPLKSPIQSYAGTSAAPYQNFVTTLSPTLNSIPYYSTYFGSGASGDFGSGSFPAGAKIAVDPALNVYLAGVDQGNVKPTPGAYSTGSTGVYISKLVIMDDLALALSASPSPVIHGSNLTYTIAVTSKGPDFGVNLQVSDTLPTGTTFVSYSAGGGTCTAPPVGSRGTLNCRLAQLNKGAAWTVRLTVKVATGLGTTLSNTAATKSNMQDFVNRLQRE